MRHNRQMELKLNPAVCRKGDFYEPRATELVFLFPRLRGPMSERVAPFINFEGACMLDLFEGPVLHVCRRVRRLFRAVGWNAEISTYEGMSLTSPPPYDYALEYLAVPRVPEMAAVS